jgi:phosphoglycolate phosphatase
VAVVCRVFPKESGRNRPDLDGLIPRFNAYLFDIDGTLLDSAADICGAIQQVLSTTAKPDVSFDYLKGYIGFHLLELFQDLFPDASPEEIDAMIQCYRREYPAREHASTSVYPGVHEALDRLPGLKSTATTKSSATTRIVLDRFGLIDHFQHVQGTDDFPCKPAPDVLQRAMKGIGANPCEVLMVGDSAADMEAGRRAGVKICAVTYGYGKRDDLARFNPDYWLSDLRELVGA